MEFTLANWNLKMHLSRGKIARKEIIKIEHLFLKTKK